jgi:hypothetical protein
MQSSTPAADSTHMERPGFLSTSDSDRPCRSLGRQFRPHMVAPSREPASIRCGSNRRACIHACSKPVASLLPKSEDTGIRPNSSGMHDPTDQHLISS